MGAFIDGQGASDLAKEHFRVFVALAVIATAGVVLRFVGRRMGKIQFGADDALILVAFIFMVGLVINAGFSEKYYKLRHEISIDYIPVYLAGGMGQNFRELPPPQMVIFLKVLLKQLADTQQNR